ncbi:MAG: AAA family ATPase [Candidatus Sericytochromatia bacterium]
MRSENKLKILPIGESSFKDIVNTNKLYVDKTKDIYNLLATYNKYFFLSRPKRDLVNPFIKYFRRNILR